jgi:hypothetical protein
VEEHTADLRKLKAELKQLKLSSSKSNAKLKKKGKAGLEAAELRHSRALKKEKESHAKEKKELQDFKKELEQNAAWLQRQVENFKTKFEKSVEVGKERKAQGIIDNAELRAKKMPQPWSCGVPSPE